MVGRTLILISIMNMLMLVMTLMTVMLTMVVMMLLMKVMVMMQMRRRRRMTVLANSQGSLRRAGRWFRSHIQTSLAMGLLPP